MLIHMVIPQRMSLYAHVISEIVTSGSFVGCSLPRKGDVRRVRWGVGSRGLLAQAIRPAG